MRIDILYSDDCPSWQQGLENLKSALAIDRIEAELRLICVKDDDDAARLKFLGSPSFQVNGVDFWPEDRSNFNLSCRIYSSPEGMKGFPTVAMLLDKIRKFTEIKTTNPEESL